MLTKSFNLKNTTKLFAITIFFVQMVFGYDRERLPKAAIHQRPTSCFRSPSPRRLKERREVSGQYLDEIPSLSLESDGSQPGSTLALSMSSLDSPAGQDVGTLIALCTLAEISFLEQIKTMCPMIGHIFEETKYFREKMENPCNFKELHRSGVLNSPCDIYKWTPFYQETVGQTIGRISENAGRSFYALLEANALSIAQAKYEADHRHTLSVVKKLITMISKKRQLIIERIECLANNLLRARPRLIDKELIEHIFTPAEEFVDSIILNPNFLLGLILMMNFTSIMSCQYCDRSDIGPIRPERCMNCFQTGFAQPWYLGDKLKQQEEGQCFQDDCFLDIEICSYSTRYSLEQTSRMCKFDNLTGQYFPIRLTCNRCFRPYSADQKKPFTIEDLICFLVLSGNATPKDY